jgi:hypothetical protein
VALSWNGEVLGFAIANGNDQTFNLSALQEDVRICVTMRNHRRSEHVINRNIPFQRDVVDGLTPKKTEKVNEELRFGIVATPNPFNPVTTFNYTLPVNAQVTLNLYDITGSLVANLVDGQQPAGQHAITFNGSSLASGIYFYRLSAGENTAIQKVVLAK